MSVVKHETINDKLRPLIKWTGGKFEEYSKFSHYIPSFKNYYEPFFGGGGVFFALQPKGHCFLNDKSSDLISFYQLIHKESFKKQLEQYAEAWEQLTKLSRQVSNELLEVFRQFLEGRIKKAVIIEIAMTLLNQVDEDNYKPLFDETFNLNNSKFKIAISDSIADKVKRIFNIQMKENKVFSDEELKQHLETGFKSGLYLYLRNISNEFALGLVQLPEEKAIANWYFVREFCYASMFRYNKKGGFNIPYGGIAYNRKNFRAKVDAITSPATGKVFQNATFYNLDFEEFLSKCSPGANDFVFLDPPYDSEFSEYDQNSFQREDQVRLKNYILKCEAKCMVVIKETDFIKQLYSDSSFNIIDFDKTYTYNVRGRNNRGTKHLIILNY